jgi:hypothetical protein
VSESLCLTLLLPCPDEAKQVSKGNSLLIGTYHCFLFTMTRLVVAPGHQKGNDPHEESLIEHQPEP